MPPTPPTAQTPKIWVERTFPQGQGQTYEETHLEARTFASVPARVTAEVSRTINMGNFESIRIAVGVELPCYLEEVAAGLHEASYIASNFLEAEKDAIYQALQGPGGT